jgi:glycosyltransferase involved in cell wall biosynthesis
MSTQCTCAVDGHGPAELVHAPVSNLQAKPLDNGANSADQVLRPSMFGRRGRNVPTVKLSIIMAAYDEQDTIEQAVSEVLEVEYPCDIELIVVDDGSTDETPNRLGNIDDPRVVVFRHTVNQGKGAALMTGANLATGTHMVPFDADLEYSAEDILKLLEPVLRGRCNVVFGVRLFGYNTVYRSYIYALGNRMMTRMANVMFGACLSDLHTCLKLIPISMFRSISLKEKGFGLDTEISASLLRYGVRPFEVPVSYFSRSHEEGKKITWRDAFACLWILMRVRMIRRSRVLRTEGLAGRDDRGRSFNLESDSARHGPTQAIRVSEADAQITVGSMP